MGRTKTRKTSKRRINLNLVPNSVQNVFQMDKRIKEIPAGERVGAKALRYGKVAQSVFGKCEQFQITG